MDEYLPAVLLMGGGEGMGPIEATARALGDALYDEANKKPIGQVLVICGHNKKLANKLQSVNWKIPVQVLIQKILSLPKGAVQFQSHSMRIVNGIVKITCSIVMTYGRFAFAFLG